MRAITTTGRNRVHHHQYPDRRPDSSRLRSRRRPAGLAGPGSHTKKARHRVAVVAAAKASGKLRSGLNTAYVTGCSNGLIGDRTMGGDNNNYDYYDYYGDPCTS
jgi:hypothetical protein